MLLHAKSPILYSKKEKGIMRKFLWFLREVGRLKPSLQPMRARTLICPGREQNEKSLEDCSAKLYFSQFQLGGNSFFANTTYVSGHITSDTSWTKANSPYNDTKVKK